MDSKTQTPKTYSPKRKWAVLAATLPARFVINGLAWASFTLLLSSICQEMGWSDAQRTVLSSAYQIGQIIAMVSIGFLLDKLSVKKLFAFGVILLAGVSVLMLHFFADRPDGSGGTLYSHFWYGAVPDGSGGWKGPGGGEDPALIQPILNIGQHAVKEFARLAEILPQLYREEGDKPVEGGLYNG